MRISQAVSAGLCALIAVACSSSSEPDQSYPLAWSVSDVSGRYVELRFSTGPAVPNCDTDSVLVTGPMLPEPTPLSCSASGKPPFGSYLYLGASPPVPPLTYTFTVRRGSETKQYTATVDCYLDLVVPTSPLPGETVSAPVTLRWTPVGRGSMEYRVGWPTVSDGQPTLVDQSSMPVNVLPGTAYSWSVWATPVGMTENVPGMKCGSRSGMFTFTVQ
jgi:hypothetical protein